jgi:hypothetical protein
MVSGGTTVQRVIKGEGVVLAREYSRDVVFSVIAERKYVGTGRWLVCLRQREEVWIG